MTNMTSRFQPKFRESSPKIDAPRRGRPPKKLDEDSVYTCVLCKKHFACATGFKTHQIMAFTPGERCLDNHELNALNFGRRKDGVWKVEFYTQTLPHQISWVPSVRQYLYK